MPRVTVKSGLDLQSEFFDFGVEVRWLGEQKEITAFELSTDSYALIE